MDEAEKKSLEARGYWVGDYAEFLGLTEAERQHVELRLALSYGIRRLRVEKGLTTKALGKLIDETASRLAKVETGTVEVSLDLMFRAFFAAGGTLTDLNQPRVQPPEPDAETTSPGPQPKAKIKPKVRPKRLVKQGG